MELYNALYVTPIQGRVKRQMGAAGMPLVSAFPRRDVRS